MYTGYDFQLDLVWLAVLSSLFESDFYLCGFEVLGEIHRADTSLK
jgi:hypothetical protein